MASFLSSILVQVQESKRKMLLLTMADGPGGLVIGRVRQERERGRLGLQTQETAGKALAG